MLEANKVCAGYDGIEVVHDLDLRVGSGEIVGLMGPNGAGKTTTLLALAGVIKPSSGEVLWDGQPTCEPLHKRARAGIGFVADNRSLFRKLTTAENLRVAGVRPQHALELFPELDSKMKVAAGLLSGGEQQMLTIAKSLAREPRILLVDELSMGLGPLVVARLFETLRKATSDGLGVLLVEQHTETMLEVADRVMVLDRGRPTLSGSPQELRDEFAAIEATYLGSRGLDAPEDQSGETT